MDSKYNQERDLIILKWELGELTKKEAMEQYEESKRKEMEDYKKGLTK